MSVKPNCTNCCTKVIMSGVNDKVIMSGCGDNNPDDERREAARDYTKSVSRRADSGGGGDGDRSQRAAVLPDQGTGNQARSEGSGPWAVSYTHLRAHETPEHLVCRLLLE